MNKVKRVRLPKAFIRAMGSTLDDNYPGVLLYEDQPDGSAIFIRELGSQNGTSGGTK